MNGYSQAYIFIILIAEITSFIILTLLSVTSDNLNLQIYQQVNSPYACLRHCPYFSVLNRTLSVSCSTVWGVQDGRIYSVMNKSVQRLSSIGHEITCLSIPILNRVSFSVAILPTTHGRLHNYGVCMCSHSPTSNRARLHIIDDVNMHKDYHTLVLRICRHKFKGIYAVK